jgi:hypothetical protein
MKSATFRMTQLAAALAFVFVGSACSTWDSMTHQQQGTTVGAASGAVGGAVIGGPAGAVVGGVAGGAVGHEAAKDDTQASKTTSASSAGATTQSQATTSTNPSSGASNTAAPTTMGDTTTAPSTTADKSMANKPQASGTASYSATTNAQQAQKAPEKQGPSMSSENSSDSTVRSAQQALNDRGYDAGPVDGMMGPKTEAAIRKFQSATGLPKTGHLDSATIAALHIEQPEKAASAN